MVDLTQIIYIVFGAVLGFILAIGYDRFQRSKDELETYEKIILLISEEVKTNHDIINLLREGMKDDLELIKKGQTLSNPLPYPTQLFFDIIFYQNNKRYLTSKYFMPTINLYRSFLIVRETVTSRETYRNSNRAMENYRLCDISGIR